MPRASRLIQEAANDDTNQAMTRIAEQYERLVERGAPKAQELARTWAHRSRQE